uniref:Peroxidase-like protein n=1 Tax=Ampulex compressa TaxID=860918 RepID=A0A1W6EVW7_AMPCP|nr:peroxidase-like protein [Ampulex compressa]
MTRVTLYSILGTIAILVSQMQATEITEDLQLSLDFAQTVLDKSKRMEETIVSYGSVLPRHTAEFKAFFDDRPTKEALQRGKQAYLVLKASTDISTRSPSCSGVDAIACGKYVAGLSLEGTSSGSSCSSQHNNVRCKIDRKYRTHNGACNNVQYLSWGKTYTAYERVLFPKYVDGISSLAPASYLTKKKTLPSARTVSFTLTEADGTEEPEATLAVVQWAQFVANDLSSTVVRKMVHVDKPIRCCDAKGRYLAPRESHYFCAPIQLTVTDPVYGGENRKCMNYVRSLPALDVDCKFGPVNQMNQVSHFLDASTIYGTSSKRAKSLRTLVGGKLRVAVKDGHEYLPSSADEDASECEGTCYAAGDRRANDQPQLTALHTVWVREHNRLAEGLAKAYPELLDEELYQEARRRVIAEIQHITYHEFLPALLGQSTAEKIKAAHYDTEVSPAVNNEAATAALRSLNSLLQQNIRVVNEKREAQETLRLAENFFKPRVVESKDVLDGLLRGLATQMSQKMDLGIVADLTSKYYAPNASSLGLDVFSLDVQRGRDHGLSGYIEYRKHCGLSTVSSFNDTIGLFGEAVVQKLQKLYNNVADVDLLVGALAETRAADGLLGKTFSCLLSEQFLKTRQGDRYFYDNPSQPYPFTAAQLREIRKVTLAKVFCDNGNDIRRVQPNVFAKPGAGNEITACEQLPTANLVA